MLIGFNRRPVHGIRPVAGVRLITFFSPKNSRIEPSCLVHVLGIGQRPVGFQLAEERFAELVTLG